MADDGNRLRIDGSADRQMQVFWDGKEDPRPCFGKVDPLMAYCKEQGIMLATTPYYLDPTNVEFETKIQSGVHGLFRCAPKPERFADNLVPDGIVPEETPSILVTDGLLTELNQQLEVDGSKARKLSSWPVERAFVYLDVSDFSQFSAGQQALVINGISQILNDQSAWSTDLFQCYEAMLCIGDGYIFVMDDSVKAAAFAARLAAIVEVYVARQSVPIEFHFRMGVHCGLVYSFWDPGRRNWNYVGEGINGGNRVISAIGKDVDDVLFISWDVRQKILADPRGKTFNVDFSGRLLNRGRRKDKHGKPWRVYEVDHMGIFPEDTIP